VKTTLVCPHYIATGMFEGTHVALEWLVPKLKPSYVAQRIVQAVKYEEEEILIPTLVSILKPMLYLIPRSVKDFLLLMFGATTAMNTYKGRGIDWTLQKL